jgi:hypothetical protein
MKMPERILARGKKLHAGLFGKIASGKKKGQAFLPVPRKMWMLRLYAFAVVAGTAVSSRAARLMRAALPRRSRR